MPAETALHRKKFPIGESSHRRQPPTARTGTIQRLRKHANRSPAANLPFVRFARNQRVQRSRERCATAQARSDYDASTSTLAAHNDLSELLNSANASRARADTPAHARPNGAQARDAPARRRRAPRNAAVGVHAAPVEWPACGGQASSRLKCGPAGACGCCDDGRRRGRRSRWCTPAGAMSRRGRAHSPNSSARPCGKARGRLRRDRPQVERQATRKPTAERAIGMKAGSASTRSSHARNAG